MKTKTLIISAAALAVTLAAGALGASSLATAQPYGGMGGYGYMGGMMGGYGGGYGHMGGYGGGYGHMGDDDGYGPGYGHMNGYRRGYDSQTRGPERYDRRDDRSTIDRQRGE